MQYHSTMKPQQGDIIYVNYMDYVEWLSAYYNSMSNQARLRATDLWEHEQVAGLQYVEHASQGNLRDFTRVYAYEIKDLKKFMIAALCYGIRHHIHH